MIRKFAQYTPQIGPECYVDAAATVIGNTVLGAQVNIWPSAVLRGDQHEIRVGARSNIQDGAVLHVTQRSAANPEGFGCYLGEEVTVGHSAVIHGCRIGNRVLVGMGAIVLDGAVVEDEVMIAAGSVVSPGKRLESGYLYVGAPARKARPLSDDERAFLPKSAAGYVSLAREYLEHNDAL